MDTERRSKLRYPLELTVGYQALRRGTEITGIGHTVNVSSCGLLMVAQHAFAEGARLKMTIEWPSLLNGTTPLQLVARGKVVRQLGPNVAVALEQYQFRTKGRTARFEFAAAMLQVSAGQSPVASAASLSGRSAPPDRSAVRAAAAGLTLRSAG
jgi:hypothetical protein